MKLYKKTKARLRNDMKELMGRDKEREKIKNFWMVILIVKFHPNF